MDLRPPAPAPGHRDLQQVVVVRPTSGRVTLGVVAGTAVLVLVLSAWARQWHGLPQLAAWVALLTYLVWWWFDASSLRMDAAGLTVSNPLRWARIPWHQLEGTRVDWGLQLLAAGRRFPVAAAPARAGVGVGRSHAGDGRGGRSQNWLPTATATSGPLPRLFGPPGTVTVSLGAAHAARAVEECRLEVAEHRAAATGEEQMLRTGVHWSRFGIAIVLAAAVWLIPLLAR